MLLQVKVPAEPLVAVAAGEGLPLVVGVHVESQVVDLGNWDNFIWLNEMHSPPPPKKKKKSKIFLPGGRPCCILCICMPSLLSESV